MTKYTIAQLIRLRFSHIVSYKNHPCKIFGAREDLPIFKVRATLTEKDTPKKSDIYGRDTPLYHYQSFLTFVIA